MMMMMMMIIVMIIIIIFLIALGTWFPKAKKLMKKIIMLYVRLGWSKN
jgi:hypothetical protein